MIVLYPIVYYGIRQAFEPQSGSMWGWGTSPAGKLGEGMLTTDCLCPLPLEEGCQVGAAGGQLYTQVQFGGLRPGWDQVGVG